MSRVLFAGDLHFGHERIHKFRSDFASQDAHNRFVINNFKRYVKPRDLVFYMGDICFTDESVELMKEIPGRKILVRGNHDDANIETLLDVFENIYGLTRYKYAWLSHPPIHPDELYGKINIHGHVHDKTLDDSRYVNVSLENINYYPIDYKAIMYYRKKLAAGIDIKLSDHLQYPKSEL